MFEGLVAQDVTTPPLANEGDMNAGPGQQHTHTDTAGMQQLSPGSRQL